jgi:hypothetical protein
MLMIAMRDERGRCQFPDQFAEGIEFRINLYLAPACSSLGFAFLFRFFAS